MIRVENKKVVFNVYKNDKLFKSITLKNRLTDLYLDYVLYRLLPSPLKSVVFPNITDNDIIAPLFSSSYLKFVTTQTILDTNTTMNYDVSTLIALDGTSTINSTIGENNKSLITEYLFDLSTIVNGSLFTGIGFGRDATQDSNYLFSFIDLSLAGITKEDGVTFGVARYDEITTNEISTSGEYLPLDRNYGTLESITTCFEENGTGYEIEYNVPQTSDRAIVVGDDLNNKMLKLSFPTSGDIIDTLSTGVTIHNTVTTDKGNYIKNYHQSASGYLEYVVVSYNGNETYLYRMEGQEVNINLSSYKLPADFGTITAIDSPNAIPQYIKINDSSDLIFERLSAGVVEVTGFDNFYIEDTPLYPSNSLYPSNDIYPTNPYKIKSVKFKYLYDNSYIYTYINLEDLDGTYSDKEFKIKLKCERGDY